jgi:hypothetical protein
MAALALLAGPLLSVAATTDLLWLPLGDSITWGCGTDAAPRGGAACAGDAGGYRVPMAWALSQQVITACLLFLNCMLLYCLCACAKPAAMLSFSPSGVPRTATIGVDDARCVQTNYLSRALAMCVHAHPLHGLPLATTCHWQC